MNDAHPRAFRIRTDRELKHPQVLALLEEHLAGMRTSARHLRQGAAQAILTELLNLARQRGYARVSLETGSTPPFDVTMAMYRRFGFV